MASAGNIGPARVQGHANSETGHGEEASGNVWPVLDGFARAGFSGADVAVLAGVSPPTVSKWRRGLINIPPAKLVFLTLVLAHLLEELEKVMVSNEARNGGGPREVNRMARARVVIEVAGGLMRVQEHLNMEMGFAPIREGSQLFREWWDNGRASGLQQRWLDVFSG